MTCYYVSMRAPTDEENDIYNSLLASIESADTDSPRWDDVRDALKLLWSLAGGVVTETPAERQSRLDKEAREIEISKTKAGLEALRAALGDSMRASTPWHTRSIMVTHNSTGLEVAKWNPATGEICVGSKVGPRCYDAASAIAFIKATIPF